MRRARVRVLSDNRAVFAEILTHRADAIVTDEVEVALQVREHPGLCRGMPGILPHTRADKAVLMPKDPALVGVVNAWLHAELAAGRPAALLRAFDAGAPDRLTVDLRRVVGS